MRATVGKRPPDEANLAREIERLRKESKAKLLADIARLMEESERQLEAQIQKLKEPPPTKSDDTFFVKAYDEIRWRIFGRQFSPALTTCSICHSKKGVLIKCGDKTCGRLYHKECVAPLTSCASHCCFDCIQKGKWYNHKITVRCKTCTHALCANHYMQSSIRFQKEEYQCSYCREKLKFSRDVTSAHLTRIIPEDEDWDANLDKPRQTTT